MQFYPWPIKMGWNGYNFQNRFTVKLDSKGEENKANSVGIGYKLVDSNNIVIDSGYIQRNSELENNQSSLEQEPFDRNSLKSYGLRNDDVIDVLHRIFGW